MTNIEVKGPQVVCSAFIENTIGSERKFLLVLCSGFKVWRVPGGRAEFGENIEDTLVREMEEETGIKFENPRFLGYGQDEQFLYTLNKTRSRLLMFFHVKLKKSDEDKIKLDPEEAEDFKWVTIEEMRKIKNKEGALTVFLDKNPKLNI